MAPENVVAKLASYGLMEPTNGHSRTEILRSEARPGQSLPGGGIYRPPHRYPAPPHSGHEGRKDGRVASRPLRRGDADHDPRRLDPDRVRDRRGIAWRGRREIRGARQGCDRPHRARASGAAPPGELVDRGSARPLERRGREDPASLRIAVARAYLISPDFAAISETRRCSSRISARSFSGGE